MASVFAGKSVWIVGASSGIGEGLAHAFARTGARCILSARRVDVLGGVLATLPSPERHRIVPLDVSDPDALRPAVERVLEPGPVDVLVLASGISQRAAALETTIAVDRRIMEVNYFGLIELARLVGRDMTRLKSGRIVVVSSVMGRIGTPHRSAYAASKHALHGWFESLRAEVHAMGVRVTLVCPGYVRTQISIHALRSDGSPHTRMDRQQETGMSTEECSRRILRAVERDRDEVFIGGREVMGIYLFRFVPALLRRVVRNYRPG